MGWLFYHRERGESDLDHYRRKFGKHEDGGERVLAVASLNYGTEVYMAYRTTENKILAGVIMAKWVPNDIRFNYGYKDMEEGSGPCISNCPERILKMLSPVEELYTPRPDGQPSSLEWAKEWRARCWARIEQRKTKLKVGDVLTFKVETPFSDGRAFKEMVVQALKPFRLTSVICYRTSYGRLYRYPRERLLSNIESITSWDEYKAKPENARLFGE